MRAVWNGAIDRRPAVIALLQQRRTSGHGAEALRFASECVKTVPGDVTVFLAIGLSAPAAPSGQVDT